MGFLSWVLAPTLTAEFRGAHNPTAHQVCVRGSPRHDVALIPARLGLTMPRAATHSTTAASTIHRPLRCRARVVNVFHCALRLRYTPYNNQTLLTKIHSAIAPFLFVNVSFWPNALRLFDETSFYLRPLAERLLGASN